MVHFTTGGLSVPETNFNDVHDTLRSLRITRYKLVSFHRLSTRCNNTTKSCWTATYNYN